MFMPGMNSSKVQSVTVPSLHGGINPGSVGEAVADNQLTDCKNVWFKGGEIITRPKLETVDSRLSADFDVFSLQSIYSMVDGKEVKISVDKEFNILILSADSLFAVKAAKADIAKEAGIEADSISEQNFLLYSGKKNSDNSVGAYLLISFSANSKKFKMLFEITVIKNIWSMGQEIDKIILKQHKLTSPDSDVYIPTVLINGTGNYNANLPRLDEAEYPKATQAEGFNLLNNSYKCTFTSDSISTQFKLPVLPEGDIKISINASNMVIGNSFTFCALDDKNLGFGETAGGFYKLMGDNDVIPVDTLEFSIASGSTKSSEAYFIDGRYIWYSADGSKRYQRLYYRCKFRCVVNRENGRISFPFEKNNDFGLYKASDSLCTDRFSKMQFKGERVTEIESTDYDSAGKKVKLDISEAYLIIEDSEELNSYICEENGYITTFPKLTVWNSPAFLPLPKNGDIKNNIEVVVYNDIIESDFNKIVNCCVSEFYGGSVGKNYGTRAFVSGYDNHMYYSDIDNPLYFPENCDIGIGAAGERITALRQQSGYLVIFKENSIYYTYETELESEDISEALKTQSIVDVTAQYKYNIMTANSEVGCDLPNTIQLCMNKLIFANSDGNVYVLNSLSKYSERNIFTVSGLIKDRLKKYDISDWKAAFAVDYRGHYMIFVDDMGFILDYNKNSYKYVASYTTDSSIRKYGLFSWWIWQFPKYLKFGISTEKDISLILSQGDGDFELCTLSDEPETECESYIVSKFFDFGAPGFYKGIERLQVEMGNDCDSTLWIEHLTDGGTVVCGPIEIYKTADKGKAEYLRGRVSFPNIRLCRNYGFKVFSEGPMSISSVNINYSLKGQIKNGI